MKDQGICRIKINDTCNVFEDNTSCEKFILSSKTF